MPTRCHALCWGDSAGHRHPIWFQTMVLFISGAGSGGIPRMQRVLPALPLRVTLEMSFKR